MPLHCLVCNGGRVLGVHCRMCLMYTTRNLEGHVGTLPCMHVDQEPPGPSSGRLAAVIPWPSWLPIAIPCGRGRTHTRTHTRTHGVAYFGLI